MNTPINNGLAQSDIDCAGFDLLNVGNWPTGGGGGDGGGIPLTFLSVKDAPYNAVGDGVADDTVAIQGAIDDIFAAGGGTVFFPKGTYLCNGAQGSYESILEIPFAAYPADPVVSIELRGDNPWGIGAPIIKTTATGTGTYPSLLAGSIGRGDVYVTYTTMSHVMVILKNLQFHLGDNPTYGGVQLSGVGCAAVENCGFFAGTGTVEPTHGTTGLWLPNAINLGTNYVNNVDVSGFDTGVRSGELMHSTRLYASYCKVGINFLPGSISMGDCGAQWCADGLKFSGRNSIDMVCSFENAPTLDWRTVQHHVLDPSNNATGNIRYFVANGGGGDFNQIALSGGAGLTIVSLFSGDIRLPTGGGAGFTRAGWISGNGAVPGGGATGTFLSKNSATDFDHSWNSTLYIGTDARLVPVSGGAKLETRNTGTGIWVESARWTNP